MILFFENTGIFFFETYVKKRNSSEQEYKNPILGYTS